MATVTLFTLQHSLTQIYHYGDREIISDDEQLAGWFGLALAEIAVDHFVAPPAYYLTPMNAAWAVRHFVPWCCGLYGEGIALPETLRGSELSGTDS